MPVHLPDSEAPRTHAGDLRAPRASSAKSAAISESASAILTPETAAEDIYPLHYAAATGDRRLLQQLLDDAPQVLQRRNSSAGQRRDPRAYTADALDGLGRTPLVYAVVRDSLPCTELLLQRGGSINAIGALGGLVRRVERLYAEQFGSRFVSLFVSLPSSPILP